MIDINVGNVITVGIIAVASYAAIKMALKAANVDASWM